MPLPISWLRENACTTLSGYYELSIRQAANLWNLADKQKSEKLVCIPDTLLADHSVEGKGVMSKITLDHLRWLRVTNLSLLAWDFVGLSTVSPPSGQSKPRWPAWDHTKHESSLEPRRRVVWVHTGEWPVWRKQHRVKCAGSVSLRSDICLLGEPGQVPTAPFLLSSLSSFPPPSLFHLSREIL